MNIVANNFKVQRCVFVRQSREKEKKTKGNASQLFTINKSNKLTCCRIAAWRRLLIDAVSSEFLAQSN